MNVSFVLAAIAALALAVVATLADMSYDTELVAALKECGRTDVSLSVEHNQKILDCRNAVMNK